MPRPRALIPLALLVGLLGGPSGCAPRVATLVQHKHYREAICAAHDGGARRRGLVSDALAQDTELYLHVHRMDRAELETIVGDAAAAAAVLERVHLVRITARTNSLPLDDLGLDLTVRGDRMGAAAAPVSWETLSVATGEPVPSPQQYATYATVGNVLRALGVVFTVGVSLRFTRFRRRTFTRAASWGEHERQMPVAARLMRALEHTHCEGAGLSASAGDAGLRCTGYFVFDRSPHASWSLTLAQTYVANGDASCSHRRISTVELGRAEEWSERFGSSMRRIDALPSKTVETSWTRHDR